MTSIKSIDLKSATYQDMSALGSKLRGYVDKVADFKGASWAKKRIFPRDVTQRVLQVAIQPGVESAAQRTVLDQLDQYATSKCKIDNLRRYHDGKVADVDLRQGEYIVSTYSKTSAGFWVLDGMPVRVPQESSAGELGAVIRNALDKSREGLDVPGRDVESEKPLLDLLGLPDYTTYAKGTRSVGVYVEPSGEGETVEVTPERNEGPQRGFTPIEEEIRTFTYDSPVQLGIEVIKAFDKAA